MRKKRFSNLLILVAILFIFYVAAQVKQRTSFKSQAIFKTIPFPTLAPIKVNLPTIKPIKPINIPTIQPLKTGADADNDKIDPEKASKAINMFSKIFGGYIFLLFGGRNDNPPSQAIEPTVIQNSPIPTIPPTIPTIPTSSQLPSLSYDVKCEISSSGSFYGCLFLFCQTQDNSQTTTSCQKRSECNSFGCRNIVIRAANQEAQNRGAKIDWNRSSFTCSATIVSDSCN